jgi:hypothetical protein
MELLTKGIKTKLPKLGAQDAKPAEAVPVVVKFFAPWNQWTWFVTEGEPEDGDYRFFGMVHGLERELGYFMLSELQAVKGPFGLKIERDLHYSGHTLAEVL